MRPAFFETPSADQLTLHPISATMTTGGAEMDEPEPAKIGVLNRTITFAVPRRPLNKAEESAWQDRADRVAAKFGCYGELIFVEPEPIPESAKADQQTCYIVDDGGHTLRVVRPPSPPTR
jgi:hypothetical protein